MRIRAAAYGIVTRGDEILLAHLNGHGMHGWTLPGGGIEPGEHPEDACVREVWEETGYDVRLTGLAGVDAAVIPAETRHGGAREPLQALRMLYAADVTGGALRVEKDGSTDDAAWVRLDDVAALRHVAVVDLALTLLDTPRALLTLHR